MPESEKGFEVKDKRKAKEVLEGEGGAAPEEAARTPEGSPGAEKAAQVSGGERPGEKKSGQGTPKEGRELPPIDFMSFIGSLAATAFLHMGEKLSSGQPEMPEDLAAAKQMIDLIDLIKTKTKGNLEKYEEDGLESMLYNLRMRYLHKSAKK